MLRPFGKVLVGQSTKLILIRKYPIWKSHILLSLSILAYNSYRKLRDDALFGFGFGWVELAQIVPVSGIGGINSYIQIITICYYNLDNWVIFGVHTEPFWKGWVSVWDVLGRHKKLFKYTLSLRGWL